MASLSPIEEARALIVKGDGTGAMDKLAEILNGDFYHTEALFLLGGLFIERGMNGVGAVITSAAIDSRETREGKPFPEALLNLGGAHKHERQNDLAQIAWLAALKSETLPKERCKIMTNLASLHINEGDPTPALEWCDKALALDPNNYQTKAQRGMACLELGLWREGWEGWMATYANGDRKKRSYIDVPDWDGSPGKTVIVYGDQGIGDEIFNANCLPDIIRISKKVIFDCHPRLPALFQRSFPEIEVYGTRKHISQVDWLDDCGADASICVADLPRFFRNTDAEWGDGRAYLKAAPFADGGGHRLRIGLSWTGGVKRTRTDLRSLPIDALVPILRSRPDAEWFSLQYTDNAAREVCELEEKTGIHIAHYPGWVECFDYDRTASFVSSLDLLITVTTTAHDLASALGVPNWVLVPSRPSWRFQLKGTTLPWYGSARLFRQHKDGEWSGVIEEIAEKLKHWGREYADAAC